MRIKLKTSDDTYGTKTLAEIALLLQQVKWGPLVLLYTDNSEYGYILNEGFLYSEIHMNLEECWRLTNFCGLLVFHTRKAWGTDIANQVVSYVKKLDKYYNSFNSRVTAFGWNTFMCDSFMIDLDKRVGNISLLKANQYIGNTYTVPKFVTCCKRGSLTVTKVIGHISIDNHVCNSLAKYKSLRYVKKHNVDLEPGVFAVVGSSKYKELSLNDTDAKDKLYTEYFVRDLDLREFEIYAENLGDFFNFDGCVDVSNWEIDYTDTLRNKFRGCSLLQEIKGLETWGTAHIKDMSHMFFDCRCLKDIAALSNWVVSGVNNIAYMFFNCNAIKSLSALTNWDVSNVTNMEGAFNGCACSQLKGLESWDVSNVVCMGSLFSNCHNLCDLTALKNWNVNKVIDMSRMFFNCTQLTGLTPLKAWSVSNVTSMKYMFMDCKFLKETEGLNNWDVSKVITMECMFSGCIGLENLYGLYNWSVSNVTNMSCMFQQCKQIETLKALSNWSVGKDIEASYMFESSVITDGMDYIEKWGTIPLDI